MSKIKLRPTVVYEMSVSRNELHILKRALHEYAESIYGPDREKWESDGTSVSLLRDIEIALEVSA